VKITFFGTRGSCPCSGNDYQTFGGNTSCVLVEVGDEVPVILDGGTGLRALGSWLKPRLAERGIPLHARLLLTHLHYDHILGLPFFSPLEDPGATLEIYGPQVGESSIGSMIQRAVTPPFFPVEMKSFRGEVQMHGLVEGPFKLGEVEALARWVPHTGETMGFRLEARGKVLAYIPDHQAPANRSEVAASVLELCQGADVLIHDAQYDDEEFARKSDWGHSTVAYAVHVAVMSKVKTLVLFHHDPSHDDERLLELERAASELAAAQGDLRVIAAREGMSLDLP
jgi:phosphoribosyl 1,2-cyclic phosphodiesterase